MAINFRLLLREARHEPSHAILFILCVALAVTTVVAITGFSTSVEDLLTRDARAIAGGDVIIDTARPLSPSLAEALAIETARGVPVARQVTFTSIVSTTSTDESLFTSVRSISDTYPLTGSVTLASGNSLSDVLSQGSAIIDKAFADRLNVQVGEVIRVGDVTLTVSDIVLEESASGFNAFSTGSVFLGEDDALASGLLGERSRVRYETFLLATPDRSANDIILTLRASAGPREEVQDAVEETQSSQRFLLSTLFFVRVLAVFIALLAGLALASTARALLRRRRDTIATLKALGMTDGAVTAQYLLLTFIFGVIGTVVGIAVGALVQYFIPLLFTAALGGVSFPQTLSAFPLMMGVAWGIGLTACFCAIPLLRLRSVRAAAILRRDGEVASRPNTMTVIVSILATLLLCALVIVKVGDLQVGLQLLAGFAVLVLLVWVLVSIVSIVVRRFTWRSRSLAVRLASRRLFARGSGSRSIAVALGVSLTLLCSIGILQVTMRESFVTSYPPDAPNVFIIDITDRQADAVITSVSSFTEQTPIRYPVVRAGITAVNDDPFALARAAEQSGDPVTRDFSLTYGTSILPRERLVVPSATGGLFDAVAAGTSDTQAQVSVMTDIADRLDIAVGDTITFLIQGIPVTARVTSLRERTSNTIEPFFYFQFRPEDLAGAPATSFLAVRVARERVSELQRVLAREHPSVSTIDVTAVVTAAIGVLDRLSILVTAFALVSLLAGVLMLLSAIFASIAERTQEGAYYALIGARRSLMLRSTLVEYALLGGIAAGAAALFANGVTWLVTRFVLDVSFTPVVALPLLFSLIATIVVVIAGVLGSFPALRTRAVTYLREHADE